MQTFFDSKDPRVSNLADFVRDELLNFASQLSKGFSL